MTRIWFNHWFSSAYNFITLLREDPNFCIICSNKAEESVFTSAADEYYLEPAECGDYARFCLEFCREHRIDVFIPRRGMQEISKRKADFEKIGISVMCDSYDIVSLLHDKGRAYTFFNTFVPENVPFFRIVTNIGDFRRTYNELCEKGTQTAFKFVHDEGGQSFRLIDNTPRGYNSLFYKQSTVRMSLEAAEAALSEWGSFAPLMMMPYLEGDEVSVDCLDTADGLIMLPRIKTFSRVEHIVFDEEILSLARRISQRVNLQCPYNIQFKYSRGKLYLLEVNTRMSGGLYMACAAAGVNIPLIAVNMLLGKRTPWQLEKKNRSVTYAENAVVL